MERLTAATTQQENNKRVVVLGAALCIALACGSGERRPSLDGSGRYMVPQARGVSLGMNWSEVQAARPDAWDNSGLTTESTPDGGIHYVFREGNRPPHHNGTSGTLAAVSAYPGESTASDPQALTRWIEYTKAYWDSVTGVSPDTVTLVRGSPGRTTSYDALVWRLPGATLVLSTEKTDSQVLKQRPPYVSATVQRPDLPL